MSLPQKVEMENEKQFSQVYPEYCCLNLVRAKESGFVDEVVSGIFFPKRGLYNTVLRIDFCPFCGSKIITIKTDSSWSWRTEGI